MQSESLVVYEVDGRIAVLTINRPDKLNALNAGVLGELACALEQARDDDAVGAVIVTGAGPKAFVAGADIAEMAAMTPSEAREFARRGQKIGALMDGLGKPVIAAIQGFALGGGCELAMACHLRVAGPKARFGQPEVQLGLIPGFGGTQRLPRIVGEGRALDMVLSGRMVGAEEAHAWGLVNRIASDEEALDEAKKVANEILSKGPVAVRLCLEAVRRGAGMTLDDALEHEAALFGVVFSTDDMKEGTAAFVEKRAPRFEGK
jgi:enoyl-CoA hydratase